MNELSRRPGRLGSPVDVNAEAALRHARTGMPCSVSFVGEALGPAKDGRYLQVVLPCTAGSSGMFVELSVRLKAGRSPSSVGLSAGHRVRVSGMLTLVATPPLIQVEEATVTRLSGTGPLTQWRTEQRWKAGVRQREHQGVKDVIEQVQQYLCTTLEGWSAGTADPPRVLFVGRERIHGFSDIVSGDDLLLKKFTFGGAALSGSNAATQISRVLASADPARHLLVVLSRGGGGVADLAVLDDARILTAVQSCRVPVLAAVGHAANKDLLINQVCEWSLPVPRNVREAIRAPLLGQPTKAQHQERDRALKAAAEQEREAVLRELGRERATVKAQRADIEVERRRADFAAQQVALTQESAAAQRLTALARQRALGLMLLAPLVLLATGYLRTVTGVIPGSYGLLGPGTFGWAGAMALVLLAAIAGSSPRRLRRRPWLSPRRPLGYGHYDGVHSIRQFNQIYASLHGLQPRLRFPRQGP